MNIYRSLHGLPRNLSSTIATIGNFDGVHTGHRWVLAQVNARAKALGLQSFALTFDPHPVRVLRPALPHSLITPLEVRLELLATTGLDATLVLPFTTELSHLTAEQFTQEVLVGALNVREVHEGENFRFGYGAAVDIHGLEALGQQLGFRTQAYDPYLLRGAPVSSSRIRQLIAAGDVGHARPLLGRPFAVRSTPASGRGYGTRYTVPTINLALYEELLPAHGVYITTLRVGAELFESVTNVGNRPTFGADSFTVESHLLAFHPVDLQADTPLELTFLKRLRAERKFESPDALRAQIMQDVAHAQRYFSLCAQYAKRIPHAVGAGRD